MLWKKLAVWFVETWAAAILLGLIMVTKFGHEWHERASAKDVLAFSAAIVLMFCVTGYLLTTVVFRSLWTVEPTWTYPVIAVVLFSAHFEMLNAGVGGAFDPEDRLLVRIAGACIVFFCTFLGSSFLQQANGTRMVASEG